MNLSRVLNPQKKKTVSIKSRFNLETLIAILRETNHICAASQIQAEAQVL